MPNYLHIKESSHETFAIGDGLSWSYQITTNATETGYSEHSNIETYEELFCKLSEGRDVLESAQDVVFVLDEIKAIFNAKTGADEAAKWANCSATEKDSLAKLFLVSASLVSERIPDGNTRKYYFGKLLKGTAPARQERINKAMGYLGEELTNKADRVDLYNSVKSSVSSYIASGDGDLIDFFNASGAYDVTDGFDAKGYFSETLRTLFNDIVRDGKY